MIVRTLRRVREESSGISLVELLISGMLTIGILAMVGTMFIQTAKITSNSTQTSKSNNVAADIANEMTSVVRVATTWPRSGQADPDPAIIDGNRESLTLYTLSNVTDPAKPAPVRVKFYIDNTKPLTNPRVVKEERCQSTASGNFWVFTGCVTTVRDLGGAVSTPTGLTDQMFTYYSDTAGTQPILIGSSNLSATNSQALVASVRIYVSVKAQGSDTKQTVISNLVVLGNLGMDD